MGVLRGCDYPRLVAIETTNRCNARCSFCPNNTLARGRQHMPMALFASIVEQCREFPLAAIEPFLNGEPFVDPHIMERLELIRSRLPATKIRLYSNGFGLTSARIDELAGIGLDHLYISLNTLDPARYRETMGLELARTLDNLEHLVRRKRVARRITFRMTRTEETSWQEQLAFRDYCRARGVRCFIVGIFNYKGDIHSPLPVPKYPCEHITRVDVLANGVVTLCCMDQEGQYRWGDLTAETVLEVYNAPVARRYRELHRTGRRCGIEPCDTCNLFWPSLEGLSPARKAQVAVQLAWYHLRHRPTGLRRPSPARQTRPTALP